MAASKLLAAASPRDAAGIWAKEVDPEANAADVAVKLRSARMPHGSLIDPSGSSRGEAMREKKEGCELVARATSPFQKGCAQ